MAKSKTNIYVGKAIKPFKEKLAEEIKPKRGVNKKNPKTKKK